MKARFALGILALAAGAAQAQVAGQITLSVEATTAANGTVTPKVTWSTTPLAANGCVANGGWSGNKAASGTELPAPVSKSTLFGLTCSWSNMTVHLNWIPPTTNTDGSALTNLSGYRIYITNPSGGSETAISLTGGSLTTATWTAGVIGKYSFAISAVTADGAESLPSTPPATWTAASATGTKSVTLTVNIPMAPTGFTVQ